MLHLNNQPLSRRARTGGSVPPADIARNPVFRALRSFYFQEQMTDWNDGWGDFPPAETRRLFWNRARFDAWATLRGNNNR